MTPEQVDQYVQALGWTPEQVLAVFLYWSHGGP